MTANVSSAGQSLRVFVLLLVGLSVPLWAAGAVFDVELFPGFGLLQLPLAMPGVAAFILVYRERGRDGVITLLRRSYDVRNVTSKVWYLPVLLIYPSIGLLDYLIQWWAGVSVPPLQFSVGVLLAYCTVFFMALGEEWGLTGYAVDRMPRRHGALLSGLLLGLLWAGYHIPGFVISGYYSLDWIFWHAIYIIAGRVLFVWVYVNAGRSLFSMALFHWTFGLFWILLPATDNLQRATPYYDPRIAACIAIGYVAIVVFLWGSRTLAEYRFAPSHQPPVE